MAEKHHSVQDATRQTGRRGERCIDTHFTKRARFVRIAQVIVANPATIGIGIGGNTAIVVRNGMKAEVIGSGLIIVIDGCNIGKANVDDFLKEAREHMRSYGHILSCGDLYEIPQRNPPTNKYGCILPANSILLIKQWIAVCAVFNNL